MRRVLPVSWFIPLLLLASQAGACTCVASFSTCNAVATTHLVFIGTVESIEPAFLSRFDQANRSTLPLFNKAYTEASERPSAEALENLKAAFRKIVPGLPDEERLQLDGAKTTLEIAELFQMEMDRGMRVRLKVKTFFKREEEGEERKSTVDDPVEVWTSAGDCGVDFQAGETYLVFADEDEGTEQLFSDKCSRTRRLSDAGDELPYLFFYQNQRKESSRLEGFSTTDRLAVLEFGPLPETVKSPAAGIIVELRSDTLIRYTETDSRGRYVFDGLPAGDYQVSAFPAGYTISPQPVAGPYGVELKENNCARQLLLVHGKK